jgi:hypothetical protein
LPKLKRIWARAESLFAAVKPKPLQPDILTDMKRARTDVVAAKAKLERGNTSETQSPPPQ